MLRKLAALITVLVLVLSLAAGACAGGLFDGLFGGSANDAAEASDGAGDWLGGLFGTPAVEEEEDKAPSEFTGQELEVKISGKRIFVHEDFKQVMDDYEAFYDSYIEFMQSANNGQPDMKKYNSFLKQSLELDEELDRIGKMELSEGDELYMLEVTARIEKKLMDALY